MPESIRSTRASAASDVGHLDIKYTSLQPQFHSTKKQAFPVLALVLISLNLVVIACYILLVYLADGRPTFSWIHDAPAVQPTFLLALLVAIFGFS